MSKRIEYLDATRGLAALSVVCSHYVLSFGLPAQTEKFFNDTPLHFWWDGFAAVSFFFVLSGFVLSLRFFGGSARPNSEFKYADYFISRIFRIWVPYFIVFLLSLLAWKFLKRGWITVPKSNPWFENIWKERLSVGEFLREALLIQSTGYKVVPPAWTLSLELAISFFVPGGAMLARNRPKTVFAGAILLAAIIRGKFFALHFVLGILLARLYRERREFFRSVLSSWFWPTFGVGFLLYTFRYSVAPRFPGLFPDKVIWYATGFGSLALIACVLASDRIQRVLSFPSVRFLGRVSYSVYLCHLAILMTFTPVLISELNVLGVEGSAAWLFGLFGTIAATAVASAFLYKYVEATSITLGKRILSKAGEVSKARLSLPA